MAKKSRVPGYLLHRPTGQARVRINGKDTYLGLYDSPESKARYREEIVRWQRMNRTVDDGFPEMSCGQLALLYLQHAENFYMKNGKPTSQVFLHRSALRPLVKLFRNLPVREFGPVKLRAVRDQFIDSGCCRDTVNRHTRRVVKAFRWAVSQEFCSPVIVTGLETVEGLQAGRTTAHDYEPVRPVEQSVIDATLPHMSSVTRAAVLVQLYTGMRPSEALAMRGRHLQMDEEVWTYTVPSATNKMAHKGQLRVVLIGARAQEVLRPLLTDDPELYILTPGKDRRRMYTVAGYRRAIHRACERAFGMPPELRIIWKTVRQELKEKQLLPEHVELRRKELMAAASEWRDEHCFHPNQLRHAFGNAARKAGGIEAARVGLGHSSAVTSEIYAEKDLAAARRLVATIG